MRAGLSDRWTLQQPSAGPSLGEARTNSIPDHCHRVFTGSTYPLPADKRHRTPIVTPDTSALESESRTHRRITESVARAKRELQ